MGQSFERTIDEPDGFLGELIRVARDNQISVKRLIDFHATIKKAIRMKVKDYLGFGKKENAEIKCIRNETNNYIGEVRQDGKEHGRGLTMHDDGHIYIRYWENGKVAPGSYIDIQSDGRFTVGEYFINHNEILR